MCAERVPASIAQKYTGGGGWARGSPEQKLWLFCKFVFTQEVLYSVCLSMSLCHKRVAFAYNPSSRCCWLSGDCSDGGRRGAAFREAAMGGLRGAATDPPQSRGADRDGYRQSSRIAESSETRSNEMPYASHGAQVTPRPLACLVATVSGSNN